MSRHDLTIKEGGFPIYNEKTLSKINALRSTISEAGKTGVPILSKASVVFSTAESAHDEPRSCYNCPLFNEKLSRCQIHSPSIVIRKFTQGKYGKDIEFWPVCGYWVYGEPSKADAQQHLVSLNPDDTGLSWVNAPEVGLKYSGSCCGGANGGDDCDYWYTEGSEPKWEAHSGFCRVLQADTGAMDACSAWTDDDLVDWRVAQDFLKGSSR